MFYSFEEAKRQWSRIPFDDFGYINAKDVIHIQDSQLADLIEIAFNVRFDVKNWRNRNNTLLEFMDLGKWKDKRVIDFGCGYGPESIQFAMAGAKIFPADINPANLFVANKALGFLSKWPEQLIIVQPTLPFFPLGNIDLFWSFGVLHHIPYAQNILRFACERLSPEGECRIVVCSDKCWVEYMGEPPPEKTWEHPRFQEFVRRSDSVGLWSDWYDQAKIENMVKDFATVLECRYLCDNKMIGVVLIPKGKK